MTSAREAAAFAIGRAALATGFNLGFNNFNPTIRPLDFLLWCGKRVAYQHAENFREKTTICLSVAIVRKVSILARMSRVI